MVPLAGDTLAKCGDRNFLGNSFHFISELTLVTPGYSASTAKLKVLRTHVMIHVLSDYYAILVMGAFEVAKVAAACVFPDYGIHPLSPLPQTS